MVGTYQDLEADALVEFAGIPAYDSTVAIDSATLSHQDGPYQTWTFEATFAP